MVQQVQRRAEDVASCRVAPDDLMAMGDPILAEQALANIVENSVRLAPNAGRRSIEFRALGPGPRCWWCGRRRGAGACRKPTCR